MNVGHPAIQKFVARLLRRSTLSRDEVQALLQLPCRVAQPQAHADIVYPGKKVGDSCLVAKGLVARFDQMRDGKRQIAAFHIAGDMCDLHSVVAPTAGWGITALSPTTVLFVPHVELRRLAITYPNIALAFWRDTTADALVLAKWVGNLGRQEARARLAHLLCEMGVRLELAGLGSRSSFILDATQEQLADALGLTAVHVNRTMQVLRRDGLVVTRNRTVEVADWQRLAAVAEFDASYLLLDLPSREAATHGHGIGSRPMPSAG